jgi:hypothetical protein
LSFRAKSRNLSLFFVSFFTIRDVSTEFILSGAEGLDMTRTLHFAVIGIFASLAGVFAQESPIPSASVSLTPSPSSSPTASPVRSVRISFVPPPLEGTINLGVYDNAGKLVRILHRQASVDAFTIGADALQTKWDGKDNEGQDLPVGKYHARGYVIASLQVEKLPADAAASPPPTSNDSVAIKLMANPLLKNDRPIVQLAVGFDATGTFLKTTDELPLYVICERTDVTALVATKSGEKSIDVWQDSSVGIEHFRISKLDQMMAFDCGAFDLK